METFKLTLERYETPFEVGELIFDYLGGPLMGGCIGYNRSEANLPDNGGKVILEYQRIKYPGPAIMCRDDEGVLDGIEYSIKCKFPKEAVKWWKILEPKLNAWDAPAKEFEIEGKGITQKMIDKVKQRLSGK